MVCLTRDKIKEKASSDVAVNWFSKSNSVAISNTVMHLFSTLLSQDGRCRWMDCQQFLTWVLHPEIQINPDCSTCEISVNVFKSGSILSRSGVVHINLPASVKQSSASGAPAKSTELKIFGG